MTPLESARPPAVAQQGGPSNNYRGQRSPAAPPVQGKNGQHGGRNGAAKPETLPPQDQEAEQCVLGILLVHCDKADVTNKIFAVSPDCFFDLRNQEIFLVARDMHQQGITPDIEVLTEALSKANKSHLVQYAGYLSDKGWSDVNLDYHLERLREAYRKRRVREIGMEMQKAACQPGANANELIALLSDKLDAIKLENASRLDQFAFDPDNPPGELRVRFALDDCPVSTPGNLTALVAQSKSGKTAVVGAMVSAVLSDRGDRLGFRSDGNPEKLPVLLFDTEQSRDDFWRGVDRALRRAGLERPPDWFHAYCLTGCQPEEIFQFIERAIAMAAGKQKRLHSIFIDGIGDLVSDVNNPEQCTKLLAHLHRLAIEYDCVIICVLHLNPSGDKTAGRGHLGSQLERKAESNLRLEKENEICHLWSVKQRRAPIPRERAVTFKWDDEAGMHCRCNVPPPKPGRSAKYQSDDILAVLKNHGPMSTDQWENCCTQKIGISHTHFHRLRRDLEQAGRIRKNPNELWEAVGQKCG